MDPKQRSFYNDNIAALNLTAALVQTTGKIAVDVDDDDDAKWPCLVRGDETASAKDTSTETSSTTSRDATSNASKQKRKPFCTIGT